MSQFKTALSAIILSFLATNFTAKGMNKTDFTANYDALLSEILLRPLHSIGELKIELAPNAKVGYGDSDCIKKLNAAKIPAKLNSPLVHINSNIPDDIKQIAEKQANHECFEMVDEYNNILMDNNNLTAQEHAILKQKLHNFCNELETRTQLIRQSAASLELIRPPSIVPVQHLDDIRFPHGTTKALFKFNDDRELESLKSDFKKQPTTIFCTLIPKTVAKIRSITDETPEETIDAIIEKSNKQSLAKKEELKANEIIERNPSQYGDLQEFSYQLLGNSDIVEYISNYHKHGKNGYSEEKERNEIVNTMFDGKNSALCLHNREMQNNNKRKRNQMTLEEVLELEDYYKKLKLNS